MRIIIFLLNWFVSPKVVAATGATCRSATCDIVVNEHEIDLALLLQSNISVHKPSPGQFLQDEREEQRVNTRENIIMGTGAGESITTADDAILIGENAGHSLKIAANAILIGENAGYSLTNSNDNVLIGSNAGYSITNAQMSDNTFVGTRAGKLNTAADNTFIGTEAGTSNTDGWDNTFVGEEAGERNTGGLRNTFVGQSAGQHNTDGDLNVAVGQEAMAWGESPYGNVVVGREAGEELEGTGNVAVGWLAGNYMGSTFGNTMVGKSAGERTKSDIGNTFIGYYAGYDNGRENAGTSHANTYLGYAAGYSSRNGANNVMIGACSDSTDLDCDFSSGYPTLGYPTYYPSVSQSGQSVDGATALGSQIKIKGDYGVSIGHQSQVTKTGAIAIGASATVSSQESITIGQSSSASATNSVAIGTGATVTTANSMALGGVGTYRVSVGIGTSSPNSLASLDLADTDKGFLPNRMTTAERNSLVLSTTEAGMMVYDTDEQKLYTWNGLMSAWSSAQSSDTGTSTAGGLISGMALNGETLAILEEGTTHSVDLSSLVHDITGIALNSQELVITEAGNNHSLDLSSLVTAADSDSDTSNELLTGMWLNGNSLEITESPCDTFVSGYSCDNRVRETSGETGLEADCLAVTKAHGGYTCARLNYDFDPPRCHGGTSGFSVSTNANHKSTMLCQTDIIHSVDLSSLVITSMTLNGQTLEITEGGTTHQVDMSGLSLSQTSSAQADMHGLVKRLQTRVEELEQEALDMHNLMKDLQTRLHKLER